MRRLSLPLRFAIVFSLSFAASSSPRSFFSPSPFSSSSPPFFPKLSSLFLSSPYASGPKATVDDLLTLLGPDGDNASAINPRTADQLRSCLRFIVPFNPSSSGSMLESPSVRQLSAAGELRRRGARDFQGREGESQENELIWWPPSSVLEAARLAFDSGGDPDAIHRILDPTVIKIISSYERGIPRTYVVVVYAWHTAIPGSLKHPRYMGMKFFAPARSGTTQSQALSVPDVEGSTENHCHLTRTPYGWQFMSEELNSYLAFLFEMIASRGPDVGLNVSLNRYDLFHGHMFIARESGRLGILFHAKEYPAYDKERFPYNMGYCQRGSTVAYDKAMDLRNILWLAPLPSDSGRTWVMPGVLVVLDANPEGIIYRDLVPKYVQFVRTLYEDAFGELVVDVNYLNVEDAELNFRIFIC